MPIAGIPQPAYLPVTDTLRLCRFDDFFDFAFAWYQDEETVYLVDGVRRPYSLETLKAMYHYLDQHGELYFIEIKENGTYRPVGDVCFSAEDLPIVIGDKSCRGRGIGRQVIAALIERGRELGYRTLKVREIYRWNPASRGCFESLGFRESGETENGYCFELRL